MAETLDIGKNIEGFPQRTHKTSKNFACGELSSPSYHTNKLNLRLMTVYLVGELDFLFGGGGGSPEGRKFFWS